MCVVILTAILIAAMTAQASASIFDDFGDLKGETVVEAGDLKKLTCPIGGQYNCLTWPSSLFKLNSYCVEAVGAYVSGYNMRGLLTTNGDNVSLFILEGMVAASFKRYPASLYECP